MGHESALDWFPAEATLPKTFEAKNNTIKMRQIIAVVFIFTLIYMFGTYQLIRYFLLLTNK